MVSQRQRYYTPVPKNYQPVGKYSDMLARLATELLVRTSATAERQRGHFIPFGKQQWEAMFGGNYPKVLSCAKESGLIEVNDRYSDGRNGITDPFPKSLRLAKEFRTGEFDSYQLSRKTRAKRVTLKPQLGAVGDWLYGHMCEYQVTLPRDSSRWDKFSVLRLKQGHLYAIFCEYGRLHTNYTSLSKRVRSTLRLGVNDLVEMDVANCQPLILGAIARREIDCADVSRWIELCERGSLYEYIVDQLKPGIAPPYQYQHGWRTVTVDPSGWNRDQAKDALIIAMFSPVPETLGNPAYQAMKHAFPDLAAWVLKRKQKYYQAVAAECQRAESLTVIGTACARLMQCSPTTPILTIHDCLIASEAKSQMVEDAIVQAFRERLSVKPRVKVKPLPAR